MLGTVRDKLKVVYFNAKSIRNKINELKAYVKSDDEKKDLGVLMSEELKFSNCLMAKNKANLMLGIFKRGTSYKSPETISKLYRSYVRSPLEYCIQFWSQRRATGMIPSLRNLSYEERFKRLGMFSKGVGDSVVIWSKCLIKMIQGIDKLNLGKLFFCIDENRTKKHVNSNIGLNVFH